MITACSIVARNYMAHVRVLAESFFAHHPDGVFTLLLIDDEQRAFDASGESFPCLRLSDLGLAPDEIVRLAAIYDVTELSTAVKPPLLRHLLNRGATDVIYLDPDVKIYGSLEDAARLARQHGIVLTPHTLAPIPKDGRWITDFQILASGIYNLGFIAVGAGAVSFIEWWWERTRREARIDPARMMFTDQRWVDFVPSFFDHFLLKDPSYNVAYWNLHERDLVWKDDAYFVNGKPLTFFHFSGYDVKTPHLLSKHQGERPRILLSERPAVARICKEYQLKLEQAGIARQSGLSYGWDTLASGLRFDRRMRRLYRESLDASDDGREAPPPNPFDPGAEGRFIDWLNEPVAGGLLPTVPRYLYAIYQDRPDLQRAFPDLTGSGVSDFFDWIRSDGVAQHEIPAHALRAASSRKEGVSRFVSPSLLTRGVNIAGYFRAELGIGEAARLLTTAIEAARVPHSTLTYDVTLSRKQHPFLERGGRGAPYDVNIVCVNADQTAAFAQRAGRQFFDGRHTVGYWFWELDCFPETLHPAFEYVDEVWTASSFVATGIRAAGLKPVYTIPLPVSIPRCSPAVTRSSLRLPEGFLFLFVFDFFSVLERKNPIGLIQAFSSAFRPGEGPVLVIKTINGDSRLTELEGVRRAAAARPDILIIDEYYSVDEKNALLGLCDCYVSLHRSEGLGLTLAEAMGLAKPVIATGYSGNMDFMTPENSYLVDYAMGTVPEHCGPYPKGSPWAEPKIEHAAELMRRVHDARKEAMGKAARARQDILTKHSVGKASATLKTRLDEISQTRTRGVDPAKGSSASRALDLKRESDQVRPTITAILDRATELLTPVSSVERGRRFRGPLLALQGLLFRVLRPYWWQQRQVQGLLLDGLREVARSADRTVALKRGEQEAREAIDLLWEAVNTLKRGREEDQAELSRWNTSPVDASTSASIARFQTAAALHLKALTDQLALNTVDLTQLLQRMYPIPYMRDEEQFNDSDRDGKPVMGFHTKRSLNGDPYVGFEDMFRGSESFVQDRLRFYLPLLESHERVIDIGCGRGELLDLLKESGVAAIGVDISEAMVQHCRDKGHTVEQADAISFLRAQADSSLPAIVAVQVVEHLSYNDLMQFLQLSLAKLEPGGQLIFETVNPHALEALKTFWVDLTHERPIFPEVSLAWCWLLGFDRARVFFPNGSGDLEHDRQTQGEYGVVASKGAAG